MGTEANKSASSPVAKNLQELIRIRESIDSLRSARESAISELRKSKTKWPQTVEYNGKRYVFHGPSHAPRAVESN